MNTQTPIHFRKILNDENISISSENSKQTQETKQNHLIISSNISMKINQERIYTIQNKCGNKTDRYETSRRLKWNGLKQ